MDSKSIKRMPEAIKNLNQNIELFIDDILLCDPEMHQNAKHAQSNRQPPDNIVVTCHVMIDATKPTAKK